MIHSSIQIEYRSRLVIVLPEVQLQAVAVLSSIGTVSTSVLVDVDMGLHMAVQHGLKLKQKNE